MNAAPAQPARPRILVVEDDFTCRCVLLELLKGFGEVHVAVNGAEAVAAFQAATQAGSPYGLVCLDLFMPGMDGLEVLRSLRGFEKERGILSSAGAKVLMVTGSQDLKDVFRAYHGLCDGYIVKPIDKAEIVAEMRRVGFLG